MPVQARHNGLAARRAVVERAEAYVTSHVDSRVPVSQLCVALGISERGLRNAFYDVRGVGPKRSMLKARLTLVRAALSEPGAGPTTVARVATQYGFFELGRFAAAYHHAFGEPPSNTLRARQGRQPQRANDGRTS